MRFEWDENKNRANKRKHGVDFETALRVFADPFALSGQDRIEDGEERWQTLGFVEGHILLLVAHTFREETVGESAVVEVVRIISARKADRNERRRYEEEGR
jgi:uncharacterized DUF497 family protein